MKKGNTEILFDGNGLVDIFQLPIIIGRNLNYKISILTKNTLYRFAIPANKINSRKIEHSNTLAITPWNKYFQHINSTTGEYIVLYCIVYTNCGFSSNQKLLVNLKTINVPALINVAD